MWDSNNLMDFYEKATISAVWYVGCWKARASKLTDAPIRWPPAGTEYSDRLWAPELHALQGRWYIYFAAQHPEKGNKSHRSYVLGGPPEDQDPHAGPWEFLGPIKGMDQSQWAIDGTVFQYEDCFYYVYSGWDLINPRESEQKLYIIRLKDAVTADSSPVVISTPEHKWEFSGQAGINEGPQWLAAPDGSWKGLVYSCAGSWTSKYKMNTLQLVGDDLLDPSAWKKSDKPLLQNRFNGEGPYGPGHGCFLQAGNQTLALFHATDRPNDGNRNRRCRMQKVEWTAEGPDMGEVVGEVSRDIGKFIARNEESESHKRKLRDLAHAMTGH